MVISRSIKRLLVIIFCIALFSPHICFGQEWYTCDTNNMSDPSVVIFAKTIGHIRMAFIDDETGICRSVYAIHSALQDQRVFVKREKNYLVPKQDKAYTYSADDLKRRSASDKAFRDVCLMIDSSFFEVTNKDKISLLEAFIEKQAREAKQKMDIGDNHAFPESGYFEMDGTISVKRGRDNNLYQHLIIP